MKQFVMMAVLMVAGAAFARDTKLMVPMKDVLDLPDAAKKLDPKFKFFLAGDPAAPSDETVDKKGEGVANKKTNGMGKSDEYGCRWAALSALIELQQEAKKFGANAVYDIKSYYKKVENADPKDLECHAGALVIGVALKGKYAKLPQK